MSDRIMTGYHRGKRADSDIYFMYKQYFKFSHDQRYEDGICVCDNS